MQSLRKKFLDIFCELHDDILKNPNCLLKKPDFLMNKKRFSVFLFFFIFHLILSLVSVCIFKIPEANNFLVDSKLPLGLLMLYIFASIFGFYVVVSTLLWVTVELIYKFHIASYLGKYMELMAPIKPIAKCYVNTARLILFTLLLLALNLSAMIVVTSPDLLSMMQKVPLAFGYSLDQGVLCIILPALMLALFVMFGCCINQVIQLGKQKNYLVDWFPMGEKLQPLLLHISTILDNLHNTIDYKDIRILLNVCYNFIEQLADWPQLEPSEYNNQLLGDLLEKVQLMESIINECVLIREKLKHKGHPCNYTFKQYKNKCKQFYDVQRQINNCKRQLEEKELQVEEKELQKCLDEKKSELEGYKKHLKILEDEIALKKDWSEIGSDSDFEPGLVYDSDLARDSDLSCDSCIKRLSELRLEIKPLCDQIKVIGLQIISITDADSKKFSK